MNKYKFYKQGNNWYVHLPDWKGAKSDLLMIGGADTMLDIISNNTHQVYTNISEERFDGAEELKFVKSAKEDIGEGSYYILETYKGKEINLSVFLCDVVLFVFGKFPEKLYIQALRQYHEHFPGGTIIDLDDSEIYKHLPNTMNELNDRMLREIGYATCYMDYWHPHIFEKEKREPEMDKDWSEEEIANEWPDMVANSGFYQRQRVYKLIENFTKGRKDNWENLQWFKEQIFLFEDEIENMC